MNLHCVYYYYGNTELLFPYVCTNSTVHDAEGQLFSCLISMCRNLIEKS